MTKRRVIAAFAASALVLAACGGDGDTTADDIVDEAQDQTSDESSAMSSEMLRHSTHRRATS